MLQVRTIDENMRFVALLKRLVGEHGPLLVALGRGLRECQTKPLVGDNISLDIFLDSMLRSRISRRVLAEQHIMLNAQVIILVDSLVACTCTPLAAASSISSFLALAEAWIHRHYLHAAKRARGSDGVH